jgi:hypothetical protein
VEQRLRDWVIKMSPLFKCSGSAAHRTDTLLTEIEGYNK